MRSSDTIGKIAPALVKALHEIEGPAKDAQNSHLKNKYASLGSVIRASKDVLHAHKLAVMQFPGAMQDGVMTLDTIIVHESGEWVSGDEPFGVAVQKADPQGVGSALTYARRYGLMAALNMTAEDDDGEAAMRRQEPRQDNSAALNAAKVSIDLCNDKAALVAWRQANADMLSKLDTDTANAIVRHFNARVEQVKPKAAA